MTQRGICIYTQKETGHIMYTYLQSFVPAYFSVMSVEYVQYSREGKGVRQSIYNGKQSSTLLVLALPSKLCQSKQEKTATSTVDVCLY